MKKLNHVTRYTIFVCIGLVIFNLAFGYILTKEAAKAMRTQINERMLDISNTAAAMINGDDLAKLTADDLGSPEYQRIMEILTYFQDNIELEYIYCVKAVGEREFAYSVDPTIEDPSEYGSPIEYTEALYQASLGNEGVDDSPSKDEWGEFYSSYSPVFDSKGEVAGVVAADFAVEWYRKKMRRFLLIVTVFITLALLGGISFAIVIASHYKKYFTTLIHKMNDLSRGIETLINEVAPETDSMDQASMEGSESEQGIKDSMELLGEKIHVMQVRLAKQIESIRSHAYIDALTGLNNRNSYMEYLEALEKKLSENTDYRFSVVVFDINQLKIINDDFGHDTGDKLIYAISQDIVEAFRGNRIYRVGGDEFVAILDEEDPSERVRKVKDTIARKNAESPIFHNPGVEIGLSVGAAIYDPATDRNYSEVFNRADNAMYADKRAFYQTHEDRRKKRE